MQELPPVSETLPTKGTTFLSMLREWIKTKVKPVLPQPAIEWYKMQHRGWKCRLPLAWVLFGSLRRLQPIRSHFGAYCGQCIDRYYIERFLGQYGNDIQGHVLELADNAYTRQFGGERVVHSDVLHSTPDNPQATIIADLTRGDNILGDLRLYHPDPDIAIYLRR